MPAYRYKAIARDKSTVEGVVEAYDELAAIDQIRENCPVVVSIREVSTRQSFLATEIGPKKIGLKPLSLLCSQFAIVLAAGMPIAAALQLLTSQVKDKRLKKLLREAAEDVDSGYSLADSLENKGSEMLPASLIETVRAGEASGTLEHSFSNLQTYFENQAQVGDKVRSALMYPVFLLSLSGVVIAIVLGVAMPVFTDMFAQLDVELPAMTRFLMDAADLFQRRWYILVMVLLLLVILYKIYSGTERGRMTLSKLQLKLPALGEVVRMKASSQFANTMTTMLSAGLPLIRSISITARVMDNYYMSDQLGSVTHRLEEGRGLGECLTDCGCFPDLLVEMTAMGEQTGSLEATLKTIGIYFDGEVNTATARALSMLQPMITIFLGIVIGGIVVALYMPMFTMYSGM